MESVTVWIRACGRTDPGKRRKNNEDALIVFDVSQRTVVDPGEVTELTDTRALLLAVSDGMGGANAGEVASAMVIDALRELLPDALLEYAPYAALDHVVQQANTRVRKASADPGRNGMGATVTAALIRPPVALVAEVGDSRAYVLRRGELVQLTRDQSQVQSLIDSGMKREDAERLAGRNMILQAVGQNENLAVVTSRLELRQGDVLLLCSDGLTSEVPDEEIATILRDGEPVDATAARLIAAAKAHGGRDNITVVLATFGGDAFAPPRDGERVRETFKSVYPIEEGHGVTGDE